jgi:hypothetical protein
METTSLTHCESHLVEQQYESAAQIFVAQLLHDEVSLVPVEHTAWAQLDPPLLEELLLDEELELLLDELDELELLPPPPPQDCLQTVATSPTHCASHEVEQQ